MSSAEDSFVNYRQNSDSDSDEVVLDSYNNSLVSNHKNEQNYESIVSETDSEDENDLPIIRRKKKTKVMVISSDEDEEDDHFEPRALSPRTRLSITGIRPEELTSDSEIEDENSANDSNKSSESNENSQLQETKPLTDDSNSSPTDIINPISTSFNNSIMSKLSSTLTSTKDIEEKKSAIKSFNSTNSNSIEFCSPQNQIFELSSDSNNSDVKSSTPNIEPVRQKNLIQTKISSALQSPLTFRFQRPQFVSKEFLNKELIKLEELKSDLATCMNLSKVHSNLPDGGSKMLLRIEMLKGQIKDQANKVSYMIVDENEVKKSGANSIELPSWDELKAITNAIQPKHTGKIGLATFTAQKVLTMDRLQDIHGSLKTCPNESLLAEDPKGLQIELMDHQKHALTWMEWREKQKPKGGILADDMGLGKTLTMISLVLMFKNKKREQKIEESSEEDDANDNNGWLSKGRKDYHNGGTLVVAPASLLKQWESEVLNRTKRHILTICVHHGNNRETKSRRLAKYDFVVTTYNIVSREFENLSTLFGVKWERIILDEAHVIRNHKSKSSIAVCELRGKCKWALTGTPVQNKELDLFPILKFLKCSPFDDLQHWKKWIDNKSAGGQQRLNTLMKSLMLRRTKVQLQEKGKLMCLPLKIIELIEVKLDKEEMNVYQKIMTYSQTLFAQFLHQKAEKNNDAYYSSNNNRTRFLQSNDPNGAYSKMHRKIVRLHGNNEVKSHQILVLLLRLRQICCHPGLIDAMLEDENDVNEKSFEKNQSEIDLLEQLEKMQINEEHGNSATTLEESLDGSKELAMSKASSKVLLRSNPVFDLGRLSSKMKKIIKVLEEKILLTKDKAIIVSQWTSVLNILQTHLSRKGIECCCLNGTVLVKNRNDIVTNFNNEQSTQRVMLLSLTAGGVGLNLIGANHLFLIDLHWNPQLESQAQDRIYRVGQKKNVHIYKFMCKDTVEERIKTLQDHKIGIANGILTGAKAEAGSKLSIEDLKSLFGM